MSGAAKSAVDAQTTWTTGGLDLLGGGGLGGLENVYGGLTGENAADAAKEAAEIQAAAQMAALEYLKETEALPQAFREGALTELGAYYGIGIDPETGGFTSIEATRPSQEQMIQDAMASPLYSSIMGTREAGEEALARRAAAGSGLRGGATTASLVDYNTQLSNEALLRGYEGQQQQEAQRLSGLGQLAQLPSNATNIAQMTSNIGATQASGITGAAQAEQQALGTLLGLGGTLGAAAISDERLKIIDRKVSDTAHPYIDVYEWEWNDKAEQFGKKGREKGYIAQEVEKVWPEFVTTNDKGYKMVYKEALEQKLEEMANG